MFANNPCNVARLSDVRTSSDVAPDLLAQRCEESHLDCHQSDPGRFQSPLLPPLLCISRMLSIVMPRSADLHMSYTVSAATDAAVSASISTPVWPGHFALGRDLQKRHRRRERNRR